ncbi:ATP-dependent Clp protease ATP-binding subunit [Candidatus Parcubacteria bacterium]|nr:MAG: ATP-dependent Clp protease ATP-binding subunit [Candidatus Parcubacteria bacterium]
MSNITHYFNIYRFFNHKKVVFLRFLILISLILSLAISFNNIPQFKIILLASSLFLVNEVFIQFKVNKVKPSEEAISEENLQDQIFFAPRLIFRDSPDVPTLIKKLMQEKEIKFIIEKIGKDPQLEELSFSKQEILEQAGKLVIDLEGQDITSADLFISFLILSEEKTRFLENQELTKKDAINILSWARQRFDIDNKEKTILTLFGKGAFDSLAEGWSIETLKYTVNLTLKVLSAKYMPKLIGRSEEYSHLISILSKNDLNNILLVGEPGIGKTTLVEYITYEIYMRNVPVRLGRRRVYELLVGKLMAGNQNSDSINEKIDALFSELVHTGSIVFFLQNFENIFGGGGFNLDISGNLYEYLENSSIPIIATTTNSAYKKYLEERTDVKKFFEVIRLKEPNVKETYLVLLTKVEEFEKKYKTNIQYSAIKETISLSSLYLPEKSSPGRDVNLLEEVCAQARNKKQINITKKDIIEKVEEKTSVPIAGPENEEKSLLLNLEEEIHKRIIDQEQAVQGIASALRRLRSGFVKGERPISVFLFLGPTGVGKTETAKALAEVYYKNKNSMLRFDMSEYQTQEQIKRLLGEIPGEEYVPNTLAEQVLNNPFSLILLDEFEKAHPHLLDIFLQVFDEGRLTDNRGRTVSFNNCIIIATSNAGSSLVHDLVSQNLNNDDIKKQLLDHLLKSNIYKPELLNRFDEVMFFKPLSFEDAKQVSRLILLSSLKKLEEKEIFITFSEKVLEKIIKEGYSREFGARNIRRYIENHIEEFIARQILEEKIVKGERRTLSIDDQDQFIVE